MMRTSLLLMFTALVAAASPAHAQATKSARPVASDASRWAAFLGCWTPAARQADADTQVCIVPSVDGRGVQMTTFAGERELLSETIVADGSPQAASDKDCRGERSSRWADAGPRLFSSSTLTCAGRPPVTTTGISALVSADRWVDVQVADTGGRSQVRTRRFWRSSVDPPASVADAVQQLAPAPVVSAGVNTEDVIEASKAVSALGVEAWLAESGARVPVNRRALVRLSDAKVGANVIDLLVALAFPQKFEVRRAGSSGGAGGELFGGSTVDIYFPGEWGDLADVYGIGFGSFGAPSYLGSCCYYPLDGFYYTPPAGGGGGEPAEDISHGQVINGQGYTRVQPREPYRGTADGRSGGAQTASGSGSGSSDSGSSSGGLSGGSSGGSSGASPAGYSGGGGTSTGLSAVPR